MNPAPTIRIGLTVELGRVREIAIEQVGPAPATALFVGAPAGAVPARAAMIFALCPVTQSVAAELALAAAREEIPVLHRGRLIALAAEHHRENLRSLILSWPGKTPDSETLSVLRTALGALQGLEVSGDADMRARIALLRQCVANLGFDPDDASDSRWFPRMLAGVMSDPALAQLIAHDGYAVAPLSDDAMFDAMTSDAETLPHAPYSTGLLVDHLRARGAAIVETLDRLDRLAAGDIDETLYHSRPLRSGVGGAAVDSPRGRLFHVATLNDSDHIQSYRSLSPTDRNFTSEGPFVRTLDGAFVGSGATAELRVAQIAALYDPCVAVNVNIRERAHA